VPRRRVSLELGEAAWVALTVLGTVAWFQFARALAFRFGLSEAATAIGLLTAALVAATLWRWAKTDRAAQAIAEGRCPRCAASLRHAHEHARAGWASGLESWACDSCGYERSEALTCPACAA
jgi:hypothetical protein